MTADYIIIGQGISGTWLSYFLLKENKSIVVFDKNQQSASNVSGGLINPVTGRRIVTTWMINKLMSFAWKEYNAVSRLLNTTIIHQKNMLVFPSAPDLQQAFDERIKEENSFIKSLTIKKELLQSCFNFPFDVYEITPCYVIAMQRFLTAYREYLQSENVLIDETFNENELVLKEDSVEYKNIRAKKIIYADGINASNSKYWINLPFVQNKGQALLLEIDGLNTGYVYKFGHLTLIHLKENLWWAGSSNELDFTTNEATENFKNKTIVALQSILKTKFKIIKQLAALRAATVERRPFAGIHPLHNQVAILNGMGSKGCSLAPWFAKELADNLVYDKPINALADVQRFSKVLSRK